MLKTTINDFGGAKILFLGKNFRAVLVICYVLELKGLEK